MSEYGEPWKAHFSGIDDATGEPVVRREDTPEEFLDRIVACVNACAGLTTEELLSLVSQKACHRQWIEDGGRLSALKNDELASFIQRTRSHEAMPRQPTPANPRP